MAKKGNVKIEYHPEFLYFNEFIRRGGYTPKTHPEIWQSNEQRLSPYDTFNVVLDNVVLKKGRKAIDELACELLKLEGKEMKVDVQPWLDFAHNVGFEKMVARYSSTIFKLLETTFELPIMKVSPVRVRPPRRSVSFDTILKGSCTCSNILRIDPACYHPDGNWIFMPLPEAKQNLPLGLYDELVIHEILHAPFKALNGFGLMLKNYIRYEDPPSRWQIDVFGELFANLGSIAVPVLGKHFSKHENEQIAARVCSCRAVAGCQIATDTAKTMATVPFSKWAEIFRPVFNIYRKEAFLLEEYKNIDTASGKKLRGILRKKYGYSKLVRGMDKKHAKREVQRLSASRLDAMFAEVQELDVVRLLKRAHAKEKGSRLRKVFETLIEVFNEKVKSQWSNLLFSMD